MTPVLFCVYIDGLMLRLREPILVAGLVICMWEHQPMQTILHCLLLPQSYALKLKVADL